MPNNLTMSRQKRRASIASICLAAIVLVRTTLIGAPFDEPPPWAQKAIWYQIMVERFRNGDFSNDPRPDAMRGAYPGYVPPQWKVTPWNHDWYEPDDWASEDPSEFYKSIALRRFGGDLQGVLDKLDYLQDLGVTAIYFNPLNDAPSLHKYDARSYRHIDRHFGPNPTGDAKAIATEDPVKPETWNWTAADRMFLKLIREVHKRGMRLIMDYSWNHTGTTFWAWEDVRKKQTRSRFHDWYDVTSFDDPTTSQDEFRYTGWLGLKTLPEFKKVSVAHKQQGYPYEGDLQPDVKQHVFNVTRRWLDPNGDNDPSDGVDGFRLDVAADIPLGFWRDYRKFVRGIQPEAILVGEAWWTKWPEQLMNPRPFLRGDIFDSVMHYQWYKPARRYFANANGGLKPSQFVKEMERVYEGYDPPTVRNLMNLSSSHDSPRLTTSFQNKGQYKYRMGAKGNPTLDVLPPSDVTLREMRMFLLHQFTFYSAPHIWNGEEFGMWGADDPDCRKPLLWQDIDFRPQAYGANGRLATPIAVKPNAELFSYYRSLTRLRKQRPELVDGELEFCLVDDSTMLLAYRRTLGRQEFIVAFNRSEKKQIVQMSRNSDADFKGLFESSPECLSNLKTNHGKVSFLLAPLTAVGIGTAP